MEGEELPHMCSRKSRSTLHTHTHTHTNKKKECIRKYSTGGHSQCVGERRGKVAMTTLTLCSPELNPPPSLSPGLKKKEKIKYGNITFRCLNNFEGKEEGEGEEEKKKKKKNAEREFVGRERGERMEKEEKEEKKEVQSRVKSQRGVKSECQCKEGNENKKCKERER